MAISPDGRLLAAQLSEAAVGLWYLPDGRLRFSVEQHLMGEGCLAFSQDGASLITGTVDGAVHLWNTLSGELRHTLEGHQGPVTCIAVSHQGHIVASSGTDGQIRLWDIERFTCLRARTPPGPYVGMDISGATGLTPAQMAALQTLGAVNHSHL